MLLLQGFMSDIIRLLPDTVANQIAAGEVIQRPASAVKELLENAVDAGATHIRLMLLDAGKTLIQVIDNGKGMSASDARMCFERHATSKLRQIDDLFTLHTMGFRGEALASIASVAQVELRSRQHQDETGVKILMEGGLCTGEEEAAVQAGTSIAVKNLFYNVPARRNFLKSNPVESRHVQEEFIRVALANPAIHFSMHHNETQVFELREGNYRQRITAIFGHVYNERLVPVEEDTSIVRVDGYVGKPDFARKNRGEQYFFVNNRFVKDSYLHHAVNAAYESLIARDAYPSYWLRLHVDPALIDVNIHPTKTEIKFQHEKDVYAILRAAVKRALGKYSVAPSLDFEREPTFDLPLEKLSERPVVPSIRINPDYNPFKGGSYPDKQRISFPNPAVTSGSSQTAAWLDMHRERAVQAELVSDFPVQSDNQVLGLLRLAEDLDDFRFVQAGPKIAVATHGQGLLIMDIPGARERILYERFLNDFARRKGNSQQQLFPPQLPLSPSDFMLVQELMEDLKCIGFDITEFSQNTIVLQGVPSGIESGSEAQVLQQLLEQFRQNRDKLRLPVNENLARAMARSLMQRDNPQKVSRELRQLCIDLLHCDHPFHNLQGKVILKPIPSAKLHEYLLETDS